MFTGEIVSNLEYEERVEFGQTKSNVKRIGKSEREPRMKTLKIGMSLVCSYEMVETNLWRKISKYVEMVELGLYR